MMHSHHMHFFAVFDHAGEQFLQCYNCFSDITSQPNDTIRVAGKCAWRNLQKYLTTPWKFCSLDDQRCIWFFRFPLNSFYSCPPFILFPCLWTSKCRSHWTFAAWPSFCATKFMVLTLPVRINRCNASERAHVRTDAQNAHVRPCCSCDLSSVWTRFRVRCIAVVPGGIRKWNRGARKYAGDYIKRELYSIES